MGKGSSEGAAIGLKEGRRSHLVGHLPSKVETLRVIRLVLVASVVIKVMGIHHSSAGSIGSRGLELSVVRIVQPSAVVIDEAHTLLRLLT